MIADVNLKLEKGFAVSEGPFVKGVEAALSSVQRQQYHGGAFIGNHVHKSLQVKWNNCNRVYIILILLQDQYSHTVHIPNWHCTEALTATGRGSNWSVWEVQDSLLLVLLVPQPIQQELYNWTGKEYTR